MTGKPRDAIRGLPHYKPGKSVTQPDTDEHDSSSGPSGGAPTTVAKLSSNESPFTPLKLVQDALVEAAVGINRYPDNRCGELREMLSEKLSVATGNVAIGCGSAGLLQQLFTAYVDVGDEVVYPWRSFEVHPIYSAIAQAKVVTVPLSDEAYDLAAVAEAVNERTKLVLLSTPNNPTGTACTTEQLLELLKAVPDDVVVVIDEAYREFVTNPAVQDPIKQILPEYANALVLRTFSKAYGLANLRVGYAVGDEDVIATLDKVYAPFLVSGVAQAAAIASLAGAAADELAARVAATIAERERVSAALSQAGWPVTPSQANFVWLPVGEEAMTVFTRLEVAGILIRPFAGEGVRITIGSPGENDRVIEALGTR